MKKEWFLASQICIRKRLQNAEIRTLLGQSFSIIADAST